MHTNWIGLWTLYKREVWRFMKVWNQTLTAPMVTTLLFFAILTIALGGEQKEVAGMPFTLFITPGLIMMSIVQNAFANTSSSFMLQKIQGVIIDLLMPPLSAGEITWAVTMGGVTRGVLVGIVVSIAMYVCVPYSVHDPLLAVFYVVTASIMLSLLGMLTGIWSQTFDQLAAITNYIVTPLSFLSGTFYSVTFLPPMWQFVSHFNPFYYMIDGFRYAITGFSDASITVGIAVLMGCNVALWAAVHLLLAKGWRLKT
jgi:ABC-2 type transport system permease protein